MQKELNPRLSVADFLQLISDKNTRSAVLILDARSNSEYVENLISF